MIAAPSPQWMLLAGILLSWPCSSEIRGRAKTASSQLLQLSVILLGASLDFNAVLRQGALSVTVTFTSIVLVFILGKWGTKFFKLEEKLGLLISMGTAICGGSAIGALAPVIAASAMTITIAVGVVFMLNALAIFIFPPIGELVGLNQHQFGWWAALAIHDTSSVVAASSLYGEEALKVATTVKLIRALWIIPVTLFFSFKAHGRDNKGVKIPWFVVGFLACSLLFTFTSFPSEIKSTVTLLAKWGFSITLFLIGLSFDPKKLKEVGWRPLALGVSLWVIISTLSLVGVQFLP